MPDVGESAVEDLDKRLDASQEVRRPFEGQWLLNIAFFVGNQWVRFDGTRLYDYEPEDDDEPLVVDNRLQPAVRTEIAKLVKTQPTWIGIPADNTDRELTAARLRQHAFEHYWRALKARRLLRLALNWRATTGAGIQKVTWDAQAGRSISYLARPDEHGNMTPIQLNDGRHLTAQRAREMQLPSGLLDGAVEQTRKTGDVRLELRSPFETFPDALASELGLETCEHIGEEAVYSRTRLLSLSTDPAYQQKVMGLEANASANAGISQSRMPGRRFGLGRRGAKGYTGFLAREYWSLPSIENEWRGKHVIWIPRGELLLEENNPYPWLPYVWYPGTPVPGQFWPDCMVTQGVPLQVELNKTESQKASNAERVGNSPLMRSRASLDEFDDEPRPWRPGEELIWRNTGDPADRPDFLRVPELPGYVQNRRVEITESMREIFRQYEVTTGTVPAGVTAASAISALQESSDTVLGPDISDVEDSLAELGRRVLRLVKMYATGEQIARVAGGEGTWQVIRFGKDDLLDTDTDEVQIGSGIPQSRAAKQAAISQFLTLMIQNGQALKPRDLRRVLRDYDIGGLENFLASVNKDELQIQYENLQLLNGVELEINEFDNDELHIEGHDEMCKGAEYRELTALPDGTVRQQLIRAHVDLHKERLIERAAAAGEAQTEPTPTPNATSNGVPPNGAQASLSA